MSRTSRILAAGAAALLVVGLAGCSSDSTDGAAESPAASTPASAPASSPASALCADADATKAALDTLTSTEVLKDGTNALKTNFAALESSVTTLVDSAKTDFATEADAVRTSVEGLKTAIGSLTDSPSVADAAAVAAAIKPVKESVDTLVTSVKGAC
jgi:hypothetical protein